MKHLVTLSEPYRISALLQSFVGNLQEAPSALAWCMWPLSGMPFDSKVILFCTGLCPAQFLCWVRAHPPPSLLQRCEPYWWQIHGIHNQCEDIPRLRVQGQREGHPLDRGGSGSQGCVQLLPQSPQGAASASPRGCGAFPACTGWHPVGSKGQNILPLTQPRPALHRPALLTSGCSDTTTPLAALHTGRVGFMCLCVKSCLSTWRQILI